MISWLFPGQGSQKKGMGETVFKEFDELVSQADDILGYSIAELCLDNPQGKLNQTLYTQPAMYVVNALSFFQKTNQNKTLPNFVAGHSLGEYNALLAAGAFDFATGLKLVKKRAELLNQAAGGAMAAVLNLNVDQLQTILTNNGLDNIDIANFNAPSQTVISGIKSDITQAATILESINDVRCIILPVSGAFHSRYMLSAQQAFSAFIEGFSFGELKIPVISNVTARPYEQAKIATNLAAQITHQVNWVGSIHYLMQQNVTTFEEVGTGNVLTKLVAQIERDKPKTTTKITTSSTNNKTIAAESLGSQAFKKDYGIKYAYVAGGMTKGISSAEWVIKLGQAGLMGYFGTGGLTIPEVESNIQHIQRTLQTGQAYGMNVFHEPSRPHYEADLFDLFLKHNIACVELGAFMQITPATVKYRVKGLRRDATGNVVSPHKIMAKVSRLETIDLFLSPPPKRIVDKLLATQQISAIEAELSQSIPMADDLCIEADAGGQVYMTMMTLLPAAIQQRNQLVAKYGYKKSVRIGAAGGIGTPEAASATFMLGAEFILTGSINQCTVEAATSHTVKDILQQLTVQDTTYAPAGEMFELGAKHQVIRQGVFFPARANKLYDLYQHCQSIDDIDAKTKKQIEETYFHRSFESVYEEIKTLMPEHIAKAERLPKFKMALIFRWYFMHTMQLAIQGDPQHKMDYQIYGTSSIGAFNQWVKGTLLEDWRNRHVDTIANKLMQETATVFTQYYSA